MNELKIYMNIGQMKKSKKGDKGDKGKKGNGGKDDGGKDNYGPLLTSKEMTKRENRPTQQSEFKPTGYFLQANNNYTVTFNRHLKDYELGKIKLTIG
ncbi:hypothetical protein [Spiroplasma poulsonii]|nr:hypothetical protein [Spiroplasma poulsonii]